MKSTDPEILVYYDEEVIKLISEKYGLDPMAALSAYWKSNLYNEMMLDPECSMWEFSAFAIFDMWEAEQVTGNPRNSTYIRED